MKRKNKLYNDTILGNFYYQEINASTQNDRIKFIRCKNIDSKILDIALNKYFKAMRECIYKDFKEQIN